MRIPETNRAGALIAGRWVDTDDEWPVVSPATNETVGTIGVASPAEFASAVDAAAHAMAEAPPAGERAEALDCLADLVAARTETFVDLLATEAGKPVKHARIEVERATVTLRLAAAEARKLAGHAVPMDATAAGVGKLAFTVRIPVGVVAAITPFNFPLNLACHKLGPAIAAGCAVVLKPAEKAPLAASLLAELACATALPQGWVNLVVGDPADFVGVVADDARVGLITFTGSATVGWSIRARAAHKAVTLELGNVTPVIVDETARIEPTAARLAQSAFNFAGQSCISTQRVYVHESVAKEFCDSLATATGRLVTGDPYDPATDVGPLITTEAADRILRMLGQAEGGGGRVLVRAERRGQFVSPTVIAGAPSECDVLTKEAFGPIVTVQTYKSFSEAVDACNATDFGLQAALFSERLDRALAASKDLQFAGVLVNEVPTFRAEQMPYGGIKASGNTREGPAYAVREMTYERLVSLQSS